MVKIYISQTSHSSLRRTLRLFHRRMCSAVTVFGTMDYDIFFYFNIYTSIGGLFTGKQYSTNSCPLLRCQARQSPPYKTHDLAYLTIFSSLVDFILTLLPTTKSFNFKTAIHLHLQFFSIQLNHFQ